MIPRQLPDGTHYEVLEPGDPPRPDHDADTCGECTYVGHAENIMVTEEQLARSEITLGKWLRAKLGLYDLEDSIIAVGKFTLPRWTGHNIFWLFTCPECQLQSVDYLHGHRAYLRCPGCTLNIGVRGERFYRETGRPTPPSRRQQIAALREFKRQLGR